MRWARTLAWPSCRAGGCAVDGQAPVLREVDFRRSQGLDDVADREHPDEYLAVHDRQVAKTVRGHQLHALADRRIQGHADNSRRHDVLDEDIPWREAFRHRLTDVIALREDPDEIGSLRYGQGTDSLGG